jgi:hypothetical protein
MKTTNYRSRFLSSLAAIAIAGSLFVTACDKDDDDDDNNKSVYSLSGNASGAQEVPAVTTSATGTITGSYNKQSKQLTYTINWTGLSGDVTVAHFHGPADPGESAGPLQDIAITTNGASGSTSGTVTASDALHDALLDGEVYYNLHTAAYPDGEIRGQVALNQ